jgi:hypothetical protein
LGVHNRDLYHAPGCQPLLFKQFLRPRNPINVKRSGVPLRHPFVLYLLVLLIYAVVTSIWQAEPVPARVQAAAVVIAATCLVPIARWYARGSQGLPMFELICLSYALQFSTPVFAQPNSVLILDRVIHLPWDTLFEALLFVELGVVTLMLGYYGAHRSPLARRLPKLDLPLNPERRWVYLIGALILGGLVAFLQATNWKPLESPAVTAIARVAANQVNMAIILLAYTIYSNPSHKLAAVLLLWGAVGLAFVVGLTTGLLENALLPLAFVVAVRWQVTRRLPWPVIALGLSLRHDPARCVAGQAFSFDGKYANRPRLWVEIREPGEHHDRDRSVA